MMSNSKISKSQKAVLKQFKQLNPDVVFAQFAHVTVLVNRTGATMGEFTTSVASRDEQKIRREVGEYHAMERLAYGAAQPVFMGRETPSFMALHLAIALDSAV